MYDMNWSITIGKYKLLMLDSVEIIRAVEQLSDTATIVLPGAVYNKALKVEDQIIRGNAVTVKLGYDGLYKDEFTGYVDAIHTDDGSLRILCEDGLFKYRVGLPNKVLKNVTLKKVLDYLHQTVKGFTYLCDYSFSYEQFTIQGATAYDVLKKIQEETKANIYLKGTVLHIHPQYSEIFGSASFDFSKNIESSDLKYRFENERNVQIIVESKGRDGKVLKAESGTIGGDKVTLKIGGVASKASLQKIAEEALLQRRYTGYEGSFDAWLMPFVDSGYKVSIRDNDYEFKNGTYYVTKVVTTFSQNGGKRTISLGKRLNDE